MLSSLRTQASTTLLVAVRCHTSLAKASHTATPNFKGVGRAFLPQIWNRENLDICE